ncbi:MAG: substrate-binding domain-containing protein [Defluviitaleaceae bacterium]|nr:substrate-binding domain-containing protein [Defluviitaleaceae bacterium]MCL2261797.1 substrate-binding domain-containing protein [Defluviitaleaceae bacterium]
MKRKGLLFVLVVAMVAIFAACGGANQPAPVAPPAVPAANDPAPPAQNQAEDPAPPAQAEAPEIEVGVPTGAIHVITREAGSGTRDAFVEITGIHYDGEDRTWEEAVVQTGTGAVISAISENPASMGYISLGAMREGIRALPVNGVEATAANIIAGTYPLFRSFYLAVPQDANDLSRDFIRFIESQEGQAIIADRNYIATVENPQPYEPGGFFGSLEIEGSTSVAPLMNALASAYEVINSGVTIDVHSTGSGAGITAAIDGRVDFGMSSRSLREGELAQVNSVTMAHDGIAVIVNPSNALPSVTVDEIRQVFMGELFRWQDIEQ